MFLAHGGDRVSFLRTRVAGGDGGVDEGVGRDGEEMLVEREAGADGRQGGEMRLGWGIQVGFMGRVLV